jgi:hypothetical protein
MQLTWVPPARSVSHIRDTNGDCNFTGLQTLFDQKGEVHGSGPTTGDRDRG